jgi:hypothetical protein
MTHPTSKKATTAEQGRAFVKAARELGADESEETFDKLLKRVVKAPPPKSVQKRKAVKRKRSP